MTNLRMPADPDPKNADLGPVPSWVEPLRTGRPIRSVDRRVLPAVGLRSTQNEEVIFVLQEVASKWPRSGA